MILFTVDLTAFVKLSHCP